MKKKNYNIWKSEKFSSVTYIDAFVIIFYTTIIGKESSTYNHFCFNNLLFNLHLSAAEAKFQSLAILAGERVKVMSSAIRQP